MNHALYISWGIIILMGFVIFWQRGQLAQKRVDTLTGVIAQNEYRKVFKVKIREALKRMRYEDEYDLRLFFGDIRDFKSHNERHTHEGGDEILHVVGRKLRGQFRSAVVARRSGDEFVILVELNGTESERREAYKGICNRLRKINWTVFPREGGVLSEEVDVKIDFSSVRLSEIVRSIPGRITNELVLDVLRKMLQKGSRRNLRKKERTKEASSSFYPEGREYFSDLDKFTNQP